MSALYFVVDVDGFAVHSCPLATIEQAETLKRAYQISRPFDTVTIIGPLAA